MANEVVIGVDLAEPGSDTTVYLIDGRHYPVRHPYYLASCDSCGWIGSTELCGGGDEDVCCPQCYRGGADCGDIAQAAEDAERKASIAARKL